VWHFLFDGSIKVYPKSISCPTADYCVAVGADGGNYDNQHGTVMTTSDAGITWRQRK
jgi:hypothetical protein